MGPETIFFIVVLIFSIILHEVSHGYMAEYFGDPTARLAGRLTLNPIPHIDPVGSLILPVLLIISGSGFVFGWAKPVPYNPYNLGGSRLREGLVAGAGVLANIALAILFGLLVRFGAGILPETFIALCGTIVYVNLLLGLFNLLPIPPLDGSKVLASLLPPALFMKYRSFEESMGSLGILLPLVVILLVSALWPFLSAIISFFFILITGSPAL